MMKKPVRELTGPELAEWVARAQAMELLEQDYIVGHWVYDNDNGAKVYCVEYGENGQWFESTVFKTAICRSVVASKFGEFVEVSDE